MESTTRSTRIDHPPVWSMSDEQVTQHLTDTDRLIKHLSGWMLTLIGAADSRGLGTASGAANTAQWVAGLLRIPTGEAGATVKLARHLDRDLPASAAALEAGDISVGHARAISKVVHDLPSDVSTPQLRAEVEQTLVGHAATFDVPTVRKLGERVLHTIDPELADRILAKKLAEEEKRAQRDRYWRMTYLEETGSWRIDGRLPKEVGEQLKQIIDPLAAPQSGPGGWDKRTPEQRNADAVADIAHRMLAEQKVPTHGGNPTQMVVTLTRDGKGRTLHTGIDLSAEIVQRLMCEADKAFLLRPEHLPGDVTLLTEDQQRLFTKKLRRLLELRDGGCAFPGCDRPPSWCHAHHIVAWSKGGATTLGNGVLLCGYHHRFIHHDSWTVRLARDGLPEFIPPPWIDATRTPLRNTRLTPAA